MNEVWKDIKGYKGLYQVSNMGNIKSLSRTYLTGNNGRRILAEKILKVQISSWGYYLTQISKGGIAKTCLLHRLIAITFIPNPRKLETINHKNGNKLDNRVENLEWSSKEENNRHAQDTGLIPYKISNEDILKIKELYSTNKYSQFELADIYNVHQCFISRIVNNKRRKRAHLSKIK